jgi:hypothetical protein
MEDPMFYLVPYMCQLIDSVWADWPQLLQNLPWQPASQFLQMVVVVSIYLSGG